MKNEREERPKGNEVLEDNSWVMKSKLRRFIFIGTIAYTILILYFMFLGFNRLGNDSCKEYVFLFNPYAPVLKFPELTMSWLVDFGNIAAFIPFGIVIPLLYRIRFRKFITLFI